jgi:hypothetical protein
METAFVTPKSKKAKNRFINIMESNDEVIVEQNKGDKVFVASLNRKYFFWVDLNNDPNWFIDL